MGRAILILIACSLVMSAYVFQTQPQLVKAMLSYLDDGSGNHNGGTAAVQLSQPEKVPVRSAGKFRNPTPPAVSDTPPVVEPPADANKDSGPRVFKIASDSATLYALNSSTGPVVGVLHKGEIVEPKLEINEGGERWAFVEVAAQNISGFVQTANLERK